MRCKKCGKQIFDESIFCMYCGTKQSDETPTKYHQKNSSSILDEDIINELDSIQSEESDESYGAPPVWDEMSDGSVCDCAVGECDCDGSVWS